MVRYYLLLMTLILIACEAESRFPIAPFDITVGPLYSYVNNPVLKTSDNEADFDYKAVSSPSVVSLKDKLIMYYTAINKDGLYSIGRAESQDGVIWFKTENPVIVPDEGNFKEIVVKEPSVLYDGEKIYLFFVSVTKDNRYRIMIASSSDTFNFYRADKELVSIPDSDLNLVAISEPSVIIKEDYLWMYFTASDRDTRSYIFLAKASLNNPLSWSIESREPVFSPQMERSDAFDHYSVMSASVLTISSANKRTLFRMYYCGSATETGAFHLGLAGSFDGIKFERYAYNPILHYGRNPSALVFKGNLYLYYNELPSSESKGISLATTIKLE